MDKDRLRELLMDPNVNIEDIIAEEFRNEYYLRVYGMTEREFERRAFYDDPTKESPGGILPPIPRPQP